MYDIDIAAAEQSREDAMIAGDDEDAAADAVPVAASGTEDDEVAEE